MVGQSPRQGDFSNKRALALKKIMLNRRAKKSPQSAEIFHPDEVSYALKA
jgi:hypothetical protein